MSKTEDFYTHSHEIFSTWRNDLGYGKNANKAALAHFRRIGEDRDRPGRVNVTAFLSAPGAFLLANKLGLSEDKSGENAVIKIERLAAVSSILAEIQEPRPGAVGKALGTSKENNKICSENRFVRLLNMQDPLQFLNEGKRIVRLLGNKVDPGIFGADLYLWGTKIRIKWAFDYYGAGAALPDQSAAIQ